MKWMQKKNEVKKAFNCLRSLDKMKNIETEVFIHFFEAERRKKKRFGFFFVLSFDRWFASIANNIRV